MTTSIRRGRIAALIAAGTGTIFGGSASAAFTGISVVFIDELIPETHTIQIYADFDNPTDQVLAISATAQSFGWQSSHALVQDTPFLGTGLHDTPAHPAIAGPADSWLTIGGDWANGVTDTVFSPGFLGGGEGDLVAGTSFVQEQNGGYFDSSPGTPENGGSVIFAQFTIPDETTSWSFQGGVDWQSNGEGFTSSAFEIWFPFPAPGAIGLFLVAGRWGGSRWRHA